MESNKERCSWAGQKVLYQQYHDEEWGVPSFDDDDLFAMLCLEGAQAGLSWWTILQKRPHYYKVFDDFNAEKIAAYDADKVQVLLQDPGIVRNKLKVNAFIRNAQAYLEIKNAGGTLSDIVWSYVNHKPIFNEFTAMDQVPVTTEISDKMSKDLKKRGFTFVGSTICYAYMQSCGLVNDHLQSCWCYTRDRNG